MLVTNQFVFLHLSRPGLTFLYEAFATFLAADLCSPTFR
jgi:hypothetical protein